MQYLSAENLNALPEDVRTRILNLVADEQKARHEWFKAQQQIDHAENLKILDQDHGQKLIGTIGGYGVILCMLAASVYLISTGAPVMGIVFLASTILGAIGVVLWGHHLRTSDDEDDKAEDSGEEDEPRSEIDQKSTS